MCTSWRSRRRALASAVFFSVAVVCNTESSSAPLRLSPKFSVCVTPQKHDSKTNNAWKTHTHTPIRHILAQKKTKKTFTLLTKVSIMVSLPPDERVTKGSGDVNNDKPHEILHRQVPAQNTTVSFPTAQPVHRKNKALMVFAHCNHAPPP